MNFVLSALTQMLVGMCLPGLIIPHFRRGRFASIWAQSQPRARHGTMPYSKWARSGGIFPQGG